jgi:hypothetical protein
MNILSPSTANQRCSRPLALKAARLSLLLGLLYLLPCPAQADGVALTTSTSRTSARVGESVVVSGSVFYSSEWSWNPPWVVEMRFVTYHGTGSVMTSNLLSTPQPMEPWWPIQAETTVTVQAGDPIHLVGDFVVVIDFDGTGQLLFSNRYPWQVSVPDGVPPRLEMAGLADGGVAASWPSLYQDWRLEACDGPGLPWRAVTGPMVVEGGRCTCRLNPASAGSAPARLFRLSR